MPETDAPGGELVLYTTDDGQARIQQRAVDGTAWLSQRGIAELFGKNVRTVNEHIQNVAADGEADAAATIRDFRIVQSEGKREVSREMKFCNLDMILAGATGCDHFGTCSSDAGRRRLCARSIQAAVAKRLAESRYHEFCANRGAADAVAPNDLDAAALEQIFTIDNPRSER